MSLVGPRLPSAASAEHRSYLGISCRHRRSCTTVEDDLEPTLEGVCYCVPSLLFRKSANAALKAAGLSRIMPCAALGITIGSGTSLHLRMAADMAGKIF